MGKTLSRGELKTVFVYEKVAFCEKTTQIIYFRRAELQPHAMEADLSSQSCFRWKYDFFCEFKQHMGPKNLFLVEPYYKFVMDPSHVAGAQLSENI